MQKHISALSSPDSESRASARESLKELGKAAVPALTEALAHPSGFTRTAAAELLGQSNARESVKALLTALRGAIPDGKKVRPWQRPFVRALEKSLRSITGQSISIRDRSTAQDKNVAKYIEWWDGATAPKADDKKASGACVDWDTPQMGEKPVEKDDPERVIKLWKARSIGTTAYSYAPPSSFSRGINSR